MWKQYFQPTTLDEALNALAKDPTSTRIIAGGTDLLLEMERGARPDLHHLIDITRIPDLDQITLDKDGWVHLGPLVTHNHCVASSLIREHGLPLAQASWEVGAPQIRNRSTVAGNIITASPANDTITPLMVLGAVITLQSPRGSRRVPFADFYTGFRETVMEPDEMLVDIAFPAMKPNERGMYIKLGLRRAQAISVVHVAVKLAFDEHARVMDAQIALGAVAPVIVRADAAETFLHGKSLDEEIMAKAAELAQRAATPIDDVRGSAAYRMEMVRVCVLRALRGISSGETVTTLPEKPVLLWGTNGWGIEGQLATSTTHEGMTTISAVVNGETVTSSFGTTKTLLDWLRDEAGQTGTKEGCAEGECGACTVFLDGAAVMACLVPAPRAHGAEIVTVEGVADADALHPVQQAFVDDGAVQCGYCTPGFIMSAAKLLEEKPTPTREDVKHAITGNLCRCTGYYKILTAVENAAAMRVKETE